MTGITYFDIAAGRVPNHRVHYVYGDLLAVGNVETVTEYQVPDLTFALVVQVFSGTNQEVALQLQRKPEGGSFSALKTFYAKEEDTSSELTLPFKVNPKDTLRLQTIFSAGASIVVNAGYSLILMDDTKG